MDETNDQDDKTEEATEKKISSALEEGNVPSSREASLFVSMGAILIICSLMLRESAGHFAMALAQLLNDASDWPLRNTADALAIFGVLSQEAARLMLPIFIILLAGGLAASCALTIPQFSLQRIQPKFNKLSPLSGFSRLFGRQGQIEFLKNIIKLVIISCVIFIILQSEQRDVIDSLYYDAKIVPNMMLGILIRLLSAICVAYALLAVGDLIWARIRWQRSLRMTRREIKDEMKQSEGNPLFKAKRRSLALDRSRRRMIADVPKATLVIANPTHYAIALRYKREEGGAPLVIAKGQDLIALKIREIAEQKNIPVIEDKALARSMYDHVEVSKMIPAEFFKAVAEIIHFLHVRNVRRAVAK
jgi:flagellar biosynthetic protein FlhB